MKKLIITLACLIPFAVLAVEAGSEVKIGSTRLFYVNQPYENLSVEQRAEIAVKAIEEIMTSPDGIIDSIKLSKGEDEYAITYYSPNGRIIGIITVIPADTVGTGLDTEKLAKKWYWEIRKGISSERERSWKPETLAKLALGFLFPILVIIAYLLIHKLYKSAARAVVRREGTTFRGIKFRGVEIMPSRLEVGILLKLLLVFKWVLLVIVLYALVFLFFTLFPPTKTISDFILEPVLKWLKAIGLTLVDVAKFAAAGLVLYVIARILWGFANLIFRHYETTTWTKKLPDKAIAPLKGLVKSIIIFFFVVGLVAVIPGRAEYVALGLLLLAGIFVGIAFIPFLTSALAGIALAVSRRIKSGDIIVIERYRGEVVDIGIIWTRIKTEDGAELNLLNNYLIKKPFEIGEKEPDIAGPKRMPESHDSIDIAKG
ncbi:hypothetical protein DRQ36_08850 [bacterium]|nr:MAG: hypothetical protein DRQ36_08850 [bacterium]